MDTVPEPLRHHHRQHRHASAPAALLGVEVGERITGAPVQVAEEPELGGGQEQQRHVRAQVEAALPVAPPDQRREQRDAHRPCQHRCRAGQRRPPPAPVPGKRERGQRAGQEQRLGVGEGEHEREREDRQVQHRAPRHALVVALLGHAVEQAQRQAEQRRGEQGAPQRDRPRQPGQRRPQDRVQREEGGGVAVADRGVVAVLGDPPVPGRVPVAQRPEQRVPAESGCRAGATSSPVSPAPGRPWPGCWPTPPAGSRGRARAAGRSCRAATAAPQAPSLGPSLAPPEPAARRRALRSRRRSRSAGRPRSGWPCRRPRSTGRRGYRKATYAVQRQRVFHTRVAMNRKIRNE